jgi:membrane fusion protein, multidrug efflux system
MKLTKEDFRKILAVILGVLIIFLALFLSRKIANSKKSLQPVSQKLYKTVFADTVQNATIPISINANGNLQAVRKIELFAEVQGIFNQGSGKLFKPGEQYNAGSILVDIDAVEFKAGLLSQKSIMFNQIAAVIPDLMLDFPNEVQKWQNYLNNFDINKPVNQLPDFSSDKEKFFITGQNIVSAYFNIKNLEERLAKHQIRAPFNGVLTEALINPGALVRPGQKLGQFIDPTLYELEVAIPKSFSEKLKIGEKVKLSDIEKNRSWTGVVVRINAVVNQATQSINTYIQVSGEGLHEGMFLEADLDVRNQENAYELPRKLLIDNRKLFVVENDTILSLVEINPVFFTKETVVVKGLKDGTLLLDNILPGAYPGMLVRIETKN